MDDDIVDPSSITEVEWLFLISREVKNFFDTPVIFMTKRNYAQFIFQMMLDIRDTVRDGGPKQKILDSIIDLHLRWLDAANEIDESKEALDLSKENIHKMVRYTVNEFDSLLAKTKRFIDDHITLFSVENNAKIQVEMELIQEMHDEVVTFLLDKEKWLMNNVGDGNDLLIHLKLELATLSSWLDKVSDSVVYFLNKVLRLKNPNLVKELNTSLTDAVDEYVSHATRSVQKFLFDLRKNDLHIYSLLRRVLTHDIELSKIEYKHTAMATMIEDYSGDPISTGIVVLKHKKDFLEQRLEYLNSKKFTLQTFHDLTNIKIEPCNKDCECEEFYQVRVFNSKLPSREREKLVIKFCQHWDTAVFGDKKVSSVISIMSATVKIQEFDDEYGTFYVDKYGRKIYTIPEEATLFQLNEDNELVPLDDDENIYYYDACGRFYFEHSDDGSRLKKYKAHGTASEYVMDSTGQLIKVQEVKDGVTYYFDDYGRYYLNDKDKKIYREEGATSDYEYDDLGNLVRIRSFENIFETCPRDDNVTEEFRYLKNNVGNALKECLVDVILRQPSDPIKFLGHALLKYRENIEKRELDSLRNEQLAVEREIKIAEEREREEAERLAMQSALIEEVSVEGADDNLMDYQTPFFPLADD